MNTQARREEWIIKSPYSRLPHTVSVYVNYTTWRNVTASDLKLSVLGELLSSAHPTQVQNIFLARLLRLREFSKDNKIHFWEGDIIAPFVEIDGGIRVCEYWYVYRDESGCMRARKAVEYNIRAYSDEWFLPDIATPICEKLGIVDRKTFVGTYGNVPCAGLTFQKNDKVYYYRFKPTEVPALEGI